MLIFNEMFSGLDVFCILCSVDSVCCVFQDNGVLLQQLEDKKREVDDG